MPVCIFVPGFTGSQLLDPQRRPQLVWINYSALSFGEVNKLLLSPNGLTPLPPYGVQLIAGDPLPDYYGGFLALFGQQLAGAGYTLLPWGYDWRKSALFTGPQLANLIRNRGTVADPATVVAHSFGGLVARAAWADLVQSGDTALCRRIITLGTPHQGSYFGTYYHLRGDPRLDQAVWWSPPFGRNPVTGQFWTVTDYINIWLTYPAMYECLPQLGGPDAQDDPERINLYTAANYPSYRPPSQAHLDRVRTSFGPFLLSAASRPPVHVLTTVAGKTYASQSKPCPSIPFTGDTYFFYSDHGDNTVTQSSALMDNSAQWTLNCTHTDMPMDLAKTGSLLKMVLDDRQPPDPPPPEEVLEIVAHMSMAKLPFVFDFVSGAALGGAAAVFRAKVANDP